jgi:hypothetical protein
MIVAGILSNLNYHFLNFFFPGPPLEFVDWQIFCERMLFGTIVLPLAAALVVGIAAIFQRVPTADDVKRLNRPLWYGYWTLAILVFFWALFSALSIGTAKFSAFLNIKALIMVVLFGAGAALILSVLAFMMSRMIKGAGRYRFVTFWSRIFPQRRQS